MVISFCIAFWLLTVLTSLLCIPLCIKGINCCDLPKSIAKGVINTLFYKLPSCIAIFILGGDIQTINNYWKKLEFEFNFLDQKTGNSTWESHRKEKIRSLRLRSVLTFNSIHDCPVCYLPLNGQIVTT